MAGKEGIRHVFDLKGSFINRKVKVNHKVKPTTTLKDLNMLDLIEAVKKSGKNNKMSLGRKKTYLDENKKRRRTKTLK